VLEGGLSLDKEDPITVGRMSHISKAKYQAKREVREGKQLTICGSLGIGKAPTYAT
jgi:hypothetical protein